MIGLLGSLLSIFPMVRLRDIGNWFLGHWRLILEALVAVLLIWATWAVAGWRWNAKLQAQQIAFQAEKQEALAQAAAQFAMEQVLADSLGADLEQKLQEQGALLQSLERRLSDEIAAHPVYRECRPTAAGLQGLNDAVAAANGTR